MNMKGTIKKKVPLATAGALAVIVWAVGRRKNGNGHAGVSNYSFDYKCRFRSLQSLGTVPPWWTRDYRAFRVERSGWLTRLRPGINLELSGITRQAELLMGTLAKNYDEGSKDETVYCTILDCIGCSCLSDIEPTSGGPGHCLNRKRGGQARRC